MSIFKELEPFSVDGEKYRHKLPKISINDAGVALARAKTPEQLQLANGAMTRALREATELVHTALMNRINRGV